MLPYLDNFEAYIHKEVFNVCGMISGEEVRVLDKNAEYYHVPTTELMENAGRGVASFVKDQLMPRNKKIVVFCGPGNNGGDGFVAARYLASDYDVKVFLVGKETEIKSDIAKDNFLALKKVNVDVVDIDSLTEIDAIFMDDQVIIDAMLGIGLSGELREPYATIVNKINMASGNTVVAVDIPTGLGTNLTVKPDFTVTFHDEKEGMNNDNSGKIIVVDIGIPQKAIDYVGPGELSEYYPRPKKDSHKGDNGIVLVIGGGPYTGAPALSGLAALRTGSDLAYIATPRKAGEIVATFSPNLIVNDLNSDYLIPGDISIIRDLVVKCDSVIIGPGLGEAKETREAITSIIKLVVEQHKPLVIDADAIQPVGKQLDVIRDSRTVITPHAGEFRELTGVSLSNDISQRVKIVQEWAGKLGVVMFLKGYVDILSNGQKVKRNIIHNEAMTVGGTGDVLVGVIGALLSKDVEPFNAVRIAAFLNGEAGNRCFEDKSFGLLATDIIEEIPAVLKKYL
jgi:NAD(P)H-hydrate epimerase